MAGYNPRRSNGNLRNKVRARVLREEDTCWLCGKHVDKTLHMHDPGAPEVDEVLPVSKGGDPFDRKNCRLSHRLCNQKRGNGDRGWVHKEDPPPLKTSRQWWFWNVVLSVLTGGIWLLVVAYKLVNRKVERKVLTADAAGNLVSR